MTRKAKMSDAEQIKAFQKAARELGCDDDEKTFDKKLKKVATAKGAVEKARGPKSKT